MFIKQLIKLCGKSIFSFDCFCYLLTLKLIPGCRNNNSLVVMLSEKFNCCFQFFFGNIARTAENDSACMLDLIVKEFTEILHVHLALTRINDSRKAVKLDIM